MASLRESGTREIIVGDLVFDRRNYEIRHKKNGQVLLSVDELPYDRLDENTIYFIVPFTPQDCINVTGLAADSTGVKFTSVVKLKLNARHLKKIRLRASWTASETDSVTEVRVVGSESGTIVSVSGNTGSDAEAEATSGWTDGEYIYIEVAVTTASATSGATTDLTYAIVELEYGVR